MTDTLTHWYYYNGTIWVDITSYVVDGSCSGSYGMKSGNPTDRMAVTGEMKMTLKNSGGIFDPQDTDCLTGWGINTKIRMVVSYSDVQSVKFYGYVTEIGLEDYSKLSGHFANITVADWMGYAYGYKMTQQGIQLNKRGDEITKIIVDGTGRAPLATEYNRGVNEFPIAFDTMSVKTQAAGEINKIVMSEAGYFYNRHGGNGGEKLVFESQIYRNSTRNAADVAISDISSPENLCENLGMAGDLPDIAIAEDANTTILADSRISPNFDGVASSYSRTHGDNILNKIEITAYPKRRDTTEQVLYVMPDVIKVPPGGTKTITAKYQNNLTRESCTVITSTMIQPVATTDYLMNSQRDGLGTDMTSSLTVTVDYYTAEAVITLANSANSSGKVTKLQLRGYGIYRDSSIKVVHENASSQASYSEKSVNIDQQYQKDTEMGDNWATLMLANESDPRTKLEKISFSTGKNELCALAFINIDIGDIIWVRESTLNINVVYYYVNGIEFSVNSTTIDYSWILQEQVNHQTLELEFPDGLAVKSAILFPSVKELRNPDSLTIYSDFNLAPSVGSYRAIISTEEYDSTTNVISGWSLAINPFNKLEFYRSFSGMYQTFTTSDAFSFDTWYTICVRSSFNDTSIYIDGISKNYTKSFAQDARAVIDDGNNIKLGGKYFDAGNIIGQFVGKLRYISVYDRYLSDYEVSMKYISPEFVNNGIRFSAPYVNKNRYAHFDNLTMTTDDVIEDKIHLLPGRPYANGIIARHL